MFADWTDPQRLSSAMLVLVMLDSCYVDTDVNFSKARGNQDDGSADESVHLDLAQDILRTLFEKDLKVNIESRHFQTMCSFLLLT